MHWNGGAVLSLLFSSVWIPTVKNRWKRTKRASDKYDNPNIIARKERRKEDRKGKKWQGYTNSRGVFGMLYHKVIGCDVNYASQAKCESA